MSNFVILRAGLRALLAGFGNLQIVGECAMDADTVAGARELQPDVVVLDASPNDQETLAVIEQMKRELPAAQVLVLSATDDSYFALRLLRAGARGYLSNREATAELVNAVNTVAQGEVFLCPSASDALLTGFREQARSRKHPSPNRH